MAPARRRTRRRTPPNQENRRMEVPKRGKGLWSLGRLNRCLGRRGRLVSSGTFALAPENRIQLPAKEKEQTGEIHPGEKHDNGGEGEISRVITVVAFDIELKQLRDRHPSGR